MVDELLAVVDELDPSLKNTHSYNVVVGVLFRSGRIDKALNMLDEMPQPGADCLPNDITGGAVFDAALLRREWFGKSISDEEIVGLVNKKIGRAWDVLHDVMKAGGTVEAASCNALLTELGRDGDMKEMDIQPNEVTFGILINYMCKSRRVNEALEVFEKMKGGNDGLSVEPNVFTYNTLINGLCKVVRQEEGLTLMDRMRSENKCAPDTVTYNCLIDGSCKTGEIEMAQELFDQMNKERVFPNVITLNTLVDGMCRHGRINSAVQLFNEMGSEGLKGNGVTEMKELDIQPDVITFGIIICASLRWSMRHWRFLRK
ncbi:hypothetical protein I3760_01G062800 [Carya illinoinensis]|nr:hypothetical protein I3760_01G062800 [Carya illinoinensis]